MKPLTAGDKAPEEVNVIIEIPQGGSTKFEIDKESGVMMVDRFVPVPMFFPFNYGFIPGTHSDDGDATDVALISSYPVPTGCGIRARVIGMLEMEDEAGVDTKIIAVPAKKVDFGYAHVETIDDLSPHIKNQIKHFFDHYKDLEEGKWVKTGRFLGKQEALEVVTESMK